MRRTFGLAILVALFGCHDVVETSAPTTPPMPEMAPISRSVAVPRETRRFLSAADVSSARSRLLDELARTHPRVAADREFLDLLDDNSVAVIAVPADDPLLAAFVRNWYELQDAAAALDAGTEPRDLTTRSRR